MSNDKLSPAALAQFTGSEHWYRHGLVRTILFTDGANTWPMRVRLLAVGFATCGSHRFFNCDSHKV